MENALQDVRIRRIHSSLRGGPQSRDRASCSMSIPATHADDDETKAEGISPSRMVPH
jgi:hypothetical protein